MLARAGLAAKVLREGIGVSTVAGLGSTRPLVGPDEVTRELGLRPCPTEGDAVEEALRRRLGLAEPTGCRGGDGWWVREHADARPPVYVLAAPPTRPGMRANTADTFVGWAELLQEVRSAIRSMQSLYAAVA